MFFKDSMVNITSEIDMHSDEININSNKSIKLKFHNFNAAGVLNVMEDGRVEIG